MRADRRALDARLGGLQSSKLTEATPVERVESVALRLHQAYGAVESLLERVMRAVDGEAPVGPSGRRELIDVAAWEMDGVRPPLISGHTAAALHDLRSFRHFVRHAYAVDLDPARVEDHRRRLLTLAPALGAELSAIEAWIAGLLAAEE